MPASPLLIPSAVGILVLAVGFAFALARGAERHGRARRREQGADLRWAIRRLLDGVIQPDELGDLAAELDPGSFWSALEALSPRLPSAARGRLAEAFGGSAHVRDERRALRDDSPWRRELAARRLGLVCDPRSRRALRAALGRGPEAVTFAAALSLGRHRDAGALHWVLRHPAALGRRTRRARTAVLRGFGRGALKALTRALERGIGDPPLRAATIEALGAGGHPRAVRAIEAALADPEAEVRVAAARAIGRMRADGCAASLLAALRDDAWPVRAQAAWALGRTRAEIAARPLAERLSDPAWWVRRHAAYALAELGEEGRRTLREVAYGSSDRYAREMALEVLGGGFREYGGK